MPQVKFYEKAFRDAEKKYKAADAEVQQAQDNYDNRGPLGFEIFNGAKKNLEEAIQKREKDEDDLREFFVKRSRVYSQLNPLIDKFMEMNDRIDFFFRNDDALAALMAKHWS